MTPFDYLSLKQTLLNPTLVIMKFTAATLLALPLLAVSTPGPLAARQSAGSCNTGTIQCCQQTISVSPLSTHWL